MLPGSGSPSSVSQQFCCVPSPTHSPHVNVVESQVRWPQSPQSSSWSASQSPTGGCAVPPVPPVEVDSLPPAPTDCCAPLPPVDEAPPGGGPEAPPPLPATTEVPPNDVPPADELPPVEVFPAEPELPAEPETPLFPAPASPSKSYFLLSTGIPSRKARRESLPESTHTTISCSDPVSSCWSSRSGLARSSCRWW